MNSHLLSTIGVCVFTLTSITAVKAASSSGQGTWETPPQGRLETAAVSGVEVNPNPRFVAVTFNTGTTEVLNHDSDGDDYGEEQARFSNDYYGNGLAWVPAVEAVTDWLATLKPDVVVFQEIFYSEECVGIPVEAQVGFVCETWSPGDPTVVQVVLGSDYQVACHPGNSDKCLAVKKSFGNIRQCEDEDFCIEGLDGEVIEGCQSGARVARATIDLVSGGEITVVNLHGTSGMTENDIDCRVRQVEQVFINMDGEPAANGVQNVVMGDLNTDPERIPGSLDDSVKAWNDYVGGNQPFQWVSDDTPTFIAEIPGLPISSPLAIDHVISDAFTGSCYVPGSSEGHPPVYSNVYFDHRPQVCDIGDLPPDLVDISGTIKTAGGTDICAMVLASGQFMFSCNPPGVFSLTDLPRGNDGTVKRQIYADGFFPKVDVLMGSTDEAVVMTRSGTCPSYNTPYEPGVFPDSAGKRIDISGSVLLQSTQTPICAIVLANGEYMFSCDGSGSYALNIPLDTNGQFKLQVFADGFAPTIQRFDEFSATNDVRMARATECQ